MSSYVLAQLELLKKQYHIMLTVLNRNELKHFIHFKLIRLVLCHVNNWIALFLQMKEKLVAQLVKLVKREI